MNIKVNYEINREDYVEFNKYHFKKTRLKKTIISGAILLIVLQLFLNSEEFNLIPTLISTLVFVLVYFIAIWSSLNKTKKIPSENGNILGPKELTFTDSEIFHADKSCSGTINWSAIKSIQKGENAYYLYLDTIMAIIIPFRSFNSDSVMTDFEIFVKEKTNNS